MTWLETLADTLGYDYDPIPNFPMHWYETYGLHSKDYLFDRFTSRNPLSHTVLIIVKAVWWLLYIFPFGLWLTIIGQTINWLYTKYKAITGKNDVPENPWN